MFFFLAYFNCIIGSSFIHLIRTDSNVFFLRLSNIPLCICTTAFHSSADGHLGCFHVLAIINSAVMNIGVLVSLSDLVSSFAVFLPLQSLSVLNCGTESWDSLTSS